MPPRGGEAPAANRVPLTARESESGPGWNSPPRCGCPGRTHRSAPTRQEELKKKPRRTRVDTDRMELTADQRRRTPTRKEPRLSEAKRNNEADDLPPTGADKHQRNPGEKHKGTKAPEESGINQPRVNTGRTGWMEPQTNADERSPGVNHG